MIDKYQFGSITIEGKKYDFDVEVRSNKEVLRWQREEGHLFNLEDIERAIKEKPEIIILGTGAYGAAQVSQEAEEIIKNKGIQLIIEKTDQAVRLFNDLIKEKKRVIGLFHLTC